MDRRAFVTLTIGSTVVGAVSALAPVAAPVAAPRVDIPDLEIPARDETIPGSVVLIDGRGAYVDRLPARFRLAKKHGDMQLSIATPVTFTTGQSGVFRVGLCLGNERDPEGIVDELYRLSPDCVLMMR